MKIVRYIYTIIIILLIIAAAVSLWYYQKQDAWNEREMDALEQIQQDHQNTVRQMEQGNK